MGADRGGHFSYTFIEKALGYKARQTLTSEPERTDMPVGRIIPATLDSNRRILNFNFMVVAVEPENYFVLENWVTFALIKIKEEQTRLIVRTHGQGSGLMNRINDFFWTPLHYIMENRMLLGIKAQVETDGIPPSPVQDLLWFLGVSLSGVGIYLMVFLERRLRSIVLSIVFGILWLWPLLIFAPRPLFGLILSLVVAATMLWIFFEGKGSFRSRSA